MCGFCDLELSHVKTRLEIRNMEDKHFYVVCNWASEEHDLLKVMLMTTKQCQTVCWEKKKMKKEHLCPAQVYEEKDFAPEKKKICDYKTCKCGVFCFWLSFNFYWYFLSCVS